jgi:hypothetical protein
MDAASRIDSNSPGWVARVNLPEPSLQDNTADADRLVRSLTKEFDLRPWRWILRSAANCLYF